jgi:hypothetical protein
MKSQTLILAPVLMICFGLLRKAHAVNQPPDESCPGFNTAEAQDALFSIDVVTGFANTPVAMKSEHRVDRPQTVAIRLMKAF